MLQASGSAPTRFLDRAAARWQGWGYGTVGIDGRPAGRQPAAEVSASGPTGPTGPTGLGAAEPPASPGHPRPLQPFRAALVVVVAVVVGVFVLARTSSVPTTAATHLPSTSAPTTLSPTSVGTTTTLSAPTSTTTTPPTTLAPSKVTVLVLNGWTVRHAALYFQHKLSAAGYDTLAPTNATTETNKSAQIFVVSPGDSANALAIAALLGAPPSAVVTPTPANDSAVPASMLHQADLVLVVGGDISKQVPAGYKG